MRPRHDTTADNPTLEEQQGYWDKKWDASPLPNSRQLRRGNTILEILRTLQPVRPKVLDLGCGTGWLTARLSQLGEAMGIDLSETAIAVAKSMFPGPTYIAGNLYELSLPAKHFDVVVCQEVIAHVEDQQKLLEQISTVLTPGGYLIITTANRLVMERWNYGPDPREHIKKWLNQKEFKRILQPRFRVLRTTSIIPLGDLGILRFTNSHKVNTALGWFIGPSNVESLKEWAGLGYTLIALTQRE